jgi:hypothetical protein
MAPTTESALSILRSEAVCIHLRSVVHAGFESMLTNTEVARKLQGEGRRIQVAEMNDGKHSYFEGA